MNHAEFAAIRWLLGLEIEPLAARLAVNERTIRRWEQGKSPIPAGVQVEILDMFQAFLDAQDEALDLMGETFARLGRADIPIVEGKPGLAFTHIQYLLACMEDLEPVFVEDE